MRRAAPGVAIAALALLALVARGREGDREDGAPAPAAQHAVPPRARLFWERYREATRLRTAGRMPEAAAAYESALALDPDHEDALYYLGNVRMELGGYAEAERAWERLVEVNPRSDRGYGRLGELHLCVPEATRRDLPRAEREFRRALYLNREQTGPLLRLGEIALIREQRAKAREDFGAVLGTNAGSATAHYFAGYLAWKEGDDRIAARHFERALAAPDLPAPGGSGEGDTKAGPPRPLQDPTCPVFQAHLASAGTDGTGHAAMGESYRRLDAVLARLRPDAASQP